MSYPTLSPTVKIALAGFHKSPRFNNLVQKTAADRGRALISMMPYPGWSFEIDLLPMSPTVLDAFLDCYVSSSAGFFLFTDPSGSSVDDTKGILLNVTPGAASPMAKTGDGVSTQFQLARVVGTNGVDILQQVTVTHIKVDGSVVAAGVSSTGVVTFTSAPAAGATLSWAGTYQYLCQFTEDTLKDLGVVNKGNAGALWTCSSLAFESVQL